MEYTGTEVESFSMKMYGISCSFPDVKFKKSSRGKGNRDAFNIYTCHYILFNTLEMEERQREKELCCAFESFLRVAKKNHARPPFPFPHFQLTVPISR